MLSGLKILDLSRVLAGPYATQMMADMGAEVWKLESFRGDDTRQWGPPFANTESAYYLSVNRNKKSLAINLKSKKGQEIVQALAKQADIIIENFKANDLKRYGLDYKTIKTINPQIIYCSITGFGQTGERSHEPGYDAAIQALSGLMAMTGEADGQPVKVGVGLIDVLTGLHATVAILAALHEQKTTKAAKYIDIALFDVALASLVNQVQASLVSNKNPKRMGSSHPQIVPYQGFRASDGFFMLAVGNDSQYKDMCLAINVIELWEDSRFQTNTGRVEHRQELVAKLAEIFLTNNREHWLNIFNNNNVPATPTNDLLDALADKQVASRGLIEDIAHPKIDNLRMIASPFKHSLDKTRLEPPPLLAQHSKEILQTVLGFSDSDLDRLEQEQVIKTLKS